MNNAKTGKADAQTIRPRADNGRVRRRGLMIGRRRLCAHLHWGPFMLIVIRERDRTVHLSGFKAFVGSNWTDCTVQLSHSLLYRRSYHLSPVTYHQTSYRQKVVETQWMIRTSDLLYCISYGANANDLQLDPELRKFLQPRGWLDLRAAPPAQTPGERSQF